MWDGSVVPFDCAQGRLYGTLSLTRDEPSTAGGASPCRGIAAYLRHADDSWAPNPALKRRAILGRAYGTRASKYIGASLRSA
jgi:hypothetical protein